MLHGVNKDQTQNSAFLFAFKVASAKECPSDVLKVQWQAMLTTEKRATSKATSVATHPIL